MTVSRHSRNTTFPSFVFSRFPFSRDLYHRLTVEKSESRLSTLQVPFTNKLQRIKTEQETEEELGDYTPLKRYINNYNAKI